MAFFSSSDEFLRKKRPARRPTF